MIKQGKYYCVNTIDSYVDSELELPFFANTRDNTHFYCIIGYIAEIFSLSGWFE